MRLLVVRAAHFLHEIFSQQLGGARRQGSEAERDDMRGEIVGAKNVAHKLSGGLGSGASGHEILIFLRVAKLPRCAVETSSDSRDGNHVCPPVQQALPGCSKIFIGFMAFDPLAIMYSFDTRPAKPNA